MKKISKLLQKSNMTPRERIMTLIKDHIHRIKTGEGILSEADTRAISHGWNPTENHEVKEYNKYLKMWDMFLYLEIDMQTVFFNTLLNLAEIEKICMMYYFNTDKESMRDLFEKQLSEEEREQGRAYIIDHTGLEYDAVIHRQTFQSLPKSLQDDMESLHPESAHDPTYFDEEEQLAHFLKGKTELSKKDIDGLTSLFTDTISWERVEYMESRGLKLGSLVFTGYFAGYPMINFAHKLAEKFNIEYEDEKDLTEKVTELPKLRDEIAIIIRESIEDGLFFDEYIPLCNDDSYETFQGKTKLQHKTILDRWIRAKQKTIDEIQSYIDNGVLVIEKRGDEIFNVFKAKNIITGNSLMEAPHTLPFVEDYIKQVDLLMIYAFLFHIMEQRNIRDTYGQLLTYHFVAGKVSAIVGEEVTESPVRYLEQIDEKIKQLDLYTRGLRDQMSETVYMHNDCTFRIDMSFDDFKIDLSEVKHSDNKSLKLFYQKMQEKLGSEWERAR